MMSTGARAANPNLLHDPINRRSFFARSGAVSLAGALSGCAPLIEGFLNYCPRTPQEGGDVTWIPDVAHPVAADSVDLPAVTGVHRQMKIYYPVHHDIPLETTSPREIDLGLPPRPILRVCGAAWPILLFLHGGDTTTPTIPPYRKWATIASTVARSGYVVVVPSYNGDNILTQDDITAALADVNWVRNGWDQSHAVSKSPQFAMGGHSNGAWHAAFLSMNIPQIVTLIALGGQFPKYASTELYYTFPTLSIPKLFMFVKGENMEDLDRYGYINAFRPPLYWISYTGGHFDYMSPSDTGSAVRGPCDLIGQLAGDHAALFLGAYFRSLTHVPDDLSRPVVTLTPTQQSYAANYLASLTEINSHPGCSADLTWRTSAGSGARHFGPV